MAKLSFVSFAGVFVLGSVAFGQQYEAKEEHEILKKDVGTWTAAMKIWAGSEEPIEATGVEVNKMIGDLWVSSHFEAEIFGQKFTGSGTFGYDPDKKKFVGSWVDSMNPFSSHMEGTYDEKTQTLSMMSKGKDPSGQVNEGKNVAVYKDKDTRIFTMYMKQGDKFVKSMEITYKRKK